MPEEDKANLGSMQRAVSIEFIRNSGGFAVKAVRGQKDPAKGWDPRSNTKQKSDLLLGELINSTDNVGIHLHGPIVDVDVDTDNEIFKQALETFLPACAHVWGRPSNRRSHRVYMLKSAEIFDPSEHLLLKRIIKIPEAEVEIRGGPQTRGEFSLMPGSIHPSGEPYEWDDIGAARSSPSVATVEQLLRAIRMAGALAVLAPHWTEGSRHDLSMALAGFLYKSWVISSGLTEEGFYLDKDESLRFLEVLLDTVGDDPGDRYARVKSFESTWTKGEKGVPVTGATRIAEITGDKDIVFKLYTLLCDSPDVSAIEEFTSRFVIWQGPGIVIDLEAVKNGAQRPFMTRPQFTNSFGYKFIQTGDKKRMLADMLFTLKSTDRVAGMTFEPSAGLMVDDRSGKLVNQWCGFQIPPHESPVTDAEVKPFIDYVREVIADGHGDRYEWVMGWLSNLIQDPGNKPGTCLVLIGPPGAGKSFLGHSFIRPIIGDLHSSTVNDINAITKDFNITLDNKIFIQGDEATNNKQRASAARMRALITDPYKLIEPKGVDAFLKPNHTRFIFTTNDEEDGIFLQGGNTDRRYTILSVNTSKIGKKEEYWFPLAEWAGDRENLAKVHRWLKDRVYNKYTISVPLVTEAKVLMQQRSWDPFDGWLASWVSRGHPLSEDAHEKWFDAIVDEKSRKLDRHEWPVSINMSALVRDYILYIRHHNKRGADVLNESQLAVSLRRRGLRLDGPRRMIRVTDWDERKGVKVEKRIRLYPMPPMDQVEDFLFRKYGVEKSEIFSEIEKQEDADDDGEEF